jgi:hypothetical protein
VGPEIADGKSRVRVTKRPGTRYGRGICYATYVAVRGFLHARWGLGAGGWGLGAGGWGPWGLGAGGMGGAGRILGRTSAKTHVGPTPCLT